MRVRGLSGTNSEMFLSPNKGPLNSHRMRDPTPNIGPIVRLLTGLSVAVASIAGPAVGLTAEPEAPGHPNNLYWGDVHVHSSWSADAGSYGNRLLTPDQAYRFARGEAVRAHNGDRVRLRRPLDFLMVADHAEYLGLYPLLEAGAPELLSMPTGKRWHELFKAGRFERIGYLVARDLEAPSEVVRDKSFTRTMWDRVIDNAERHNDPGNFTAFIGYEWSSMPGSANLHRNVLFRDGAEAARQVLPFSAMDAVDPEALWRHLADYERRTGGRAMTIPHNSNLSAGRMFELHRFDGSPMTKDYADARARFEPVVEVTQIKGDSETVPYLSPDDEFADFGTWDEMRGMGRFGHRDAMYAGEYARAALGNGLLIERQLGRNPFRFGLIGSTDAHTGLATADDDNFWGKFSVSEPRADRGQDPWVPLDPPSGRLVGALMEALLPSQMTAWSLIASGYVGVWAQENTRTALFDALARREAYATTGPRMAVRFFGGFDFAAEDARAPNLAAVGYAKGVPMGSEIAAPGEATAAPAFLLAAWRDPLGANLDRIQVVKLQVTATGQVEERIYDVAVSDGRAIDADGRCRSPVGSTVDVEAATYTNAIGAATLATVWRDPHFDPLRHALYYARILAIPTPRWTTYDAARWGTERPADAPAAIQERAYTSPIWFRPASGNMDTPSLPPPPTAPAPS